MKVSISKAADMVGISRPTMYRHIEKKNISVDRSDPEAPEIDVSELVRVYGDKVNVDGEGSEDENDVTPKMKQSLQDDTPSTLQVELAVLREKVANLESEKLRSVEERSREREQLSERIENLQKTLEQSQDQQKRLSLLITDQREGQGAVQSEQDKKFEKLEQNLEKVMRQNIALNRKIKQEEEKRQAESAAEKRRQEENKPIWKKLFG